MWNTFKDFVKGLSNSRIAIVVIVYLLFFAILGNRLFMLQIVDGEKYASEAEKSTRKTRTIKATRGNIYDCNHNLLAYNKLSHNITYEETDVTAKMTSEERNDMIYKLICVIESNGGTLSVDSYMKLNSDGEPEFTVSGNTLLRYKAEVYSKTVTELKKKENKKLLNATAKDIYKFLRYDTSVNSPKFDISDKYDDKMAMKILDIRYAIFINRYQKYLPITIAKNVNDKTVAAIKENNDELIGVNITEDTKRVYNKSKYFAHILGYTGAISSEKLDTINKKNKKTDYTIDDQVGISGLESVYEDQLKGKKGKEVLSINSSTSRVVSVDETKNPVAGDDLYLTIDAKLQEECYNLLEENLAGVLISRINNSSSAGSKGTNSTDIKIPIYDVYEALYKNNIIDVTHFKSRKASSLEKSTYDKYKNKSKKIVADMKKHLATDYTKGSKDLSDDMNDFLDYFYKQLKDDNIVLVNQVDTSDSVYKKFAKGKTSLSRFLQYAISKQWIDQEKLDIKSGYYTSEEIYKKLLDYGFNKLKDDTGFAKLIYGYLVQHYELSGTDTCLLLMDQKAVKKSKTDYTNLQSGALSPYSYIIKQIKKLEITPGDLGLEPCSGSIVVTDVKTGDVKAMVTYPSYDNNKMANKVDSEYYNKKLIQNSSSPLLNRPTMQEMAPGSTFKIISSVTGMEEGVISPSTHIYDHTVFSDIDHPAKCWSTVSHGDLTVSDAIEVSCNYFFYKVGYMLSGKTSSGNINYPRGIKRLKKYADKFGLTDKSGVEIPEIAPHFATTDAVRAAIGQDTHAYTPAQLSRYVTTVANSGNCYNITLVDKIKNVKGKTVLNNKAKLRNKINIKQSSWDAVHKGMKLVVNGSRSSISFMFKNLKTTVAGKTGTAQQSKFHANHAYFISYAPYKKPKISVTCVIPNGYASSNAAQTARDVYKYYFGKKGSKAGKKVSGSVKMPESITSHID